MAMKLYYGGYGVFMRFTAAETPQEAISNIQSENGMNHLPVEVSEIAEVDGLLVCLKSPEEYILGDAKLPPQEVKADAVIQPKPPVRKPAGKPANRNTGKQGAKRA